MPDHGLTSSTGNWNQASSIGRNYTTGVGDYLQH